MLKRGLLLLSCGIFSIVALTSTVEAENPILAELSFAARTNAEKNAGVWIDGQYVGYVKELKGEKKILLLPGKHQIVVRQAWYHDYVEQAMLEPGEVHVVQVGLVQDTRIPVPKATAELKIAATPSRSVVFVDNQFAGHVDEFAGIGKGLLLTSGPHRIRIALPGYQTFETEVNLQPHQKCKIQTELVKGSITDADALVSQQ